MADQEFDRFAGDYDRVLAGSLVNAAGDSERFAEYKVGIMALRLAGREPGRLLDFGCGVGRSLKFLGAYFPRAALAGYDPSRASLDEARRRVTSASLFDDAQALPADSFDAVLVANVLHHIPPEQRQEAVDLCARTLVAGGRLFVFEHNPFNPLTRLVFERCPFDHGATMLRRREVVALGIAAGLRVARSAYTLFLPYSTRPWLRAQEFLGWLPAGAQHYVEFVK